MCAPVALEPPGTETNRAATASIVETETVNFGTDGVLVDVGDGTLPERVRLTLSLPGEDDAIQARARLTARQGTLYEFRYEAMDGNTLGRLASFIIEDQRAALRRRRSQTTSVGLDDDIDL